jgi:hypothetical protein
MLSFSGATTQLLAGDDPTADYVAPVTQLRAKDGFASDFSGVWQGDNAVLFKDWLYVISCKPWRIQQLNVDATTANISYRGALAMPTSQPLALVHAVSRKHADGNGMMYVFFSTHEKPSESSLYSFSLDAKTGTVAPKGKVKLPADHIQWAMAPGDTRLYAICEGKSIAAYRFAEDGVPVEDGTYASTGYGRDKDGFFSGDGRNLYITAPANPANPNGRVDRYDCDVASGKLTHASTLSFPESPRKGKGGGVKLCGVRPDGKYFYVLSADDKGEGALFVLKREGEKGDPTVASSDKPLPGLANLNFTADGKTGFYFANGRFNWFTCDPSTGVLTHVATSGFGLDRLRCVVLDRDHGSLFTLNGRGADSFKLKKP